MKDAGEVARIEVASDHRRPALRTPPSACSTDEPTEAEFGLALDTEMRRLGAEGPSFETIVAAGPTPACPTTAPTGVASVDGDSWCSTSGPSSTATTPT